MSVSFFVKKYSNVAKTAAVAYGLPADVVLTQAGLESAWGSAVYGNNFFGIKANAACIKIFKRRTKKGSYRPICFISCRYKQ